MKMSWIKAVAEAGRPLRRRTYISHTVYYRDFQKITESDQKITELEIHPGLFYACSGQRLRFPDRDLSYPKNVPTFFNYRRFEGVEAPEGCKNVP